MIAMLIWQPTPGHVCVFYVIAVAWGLGDAIIQTLVNGKQLYILTYLCMRLVRTPFKLPQRKKTGPKRV